jgi:predicted nucleic acid-binding protein
MIVVDAGALLEVLLNSASGRTVRSALAQDDAAAPALLDAEVVHRLLVLEKHRYLDASVVTDRVRRLGAAPVRRLDHRPLLAAARRFGWALSGYDALYAAAADALSATLLTTDLRFAHACARQFALPVTTVPTTPRQR